MRHRKTTLLAGLIWIAMAMGLVFGKTGIVAAGDLPEIQKSGVLRHLGVPYANFVTGSGDGMDVELSRLFAEYLGVSYVYVKTAWKDVIGDLTGKKVRPAGKDIEILGDTPVKGDMIANGFTILAWRQRVVNFSVAMFPTQVWIMARSDSSMQPIDPTGDIDQDIALVKSLLNGREVLGVAATCLDPSLYGIADSGAKVRLFDGELNDLAPAVINGRAEATLLDVADALIALEKWGGKIKVIGPVSPLQTMGFAFARTSPQLAKAFNRFMDQCKKDGTYLKIVQKYYPAVFRYYPEFFK
ncbi:MAG: transporter substrate-binding domain-containing protein [Proteobacteria bacterium]|nr:transporter substrate-binding domain-containing protein [Pseudomonadota bacterium]